MLISVITSSWQSIRWCITDIFSNFKKVTRYMIWNSNNNIYSSLAWYNSYRGVGGSIIEIEYSVQFTYMYVVHNKINRKYFSALNLKTRCKGGTIVDSLKPVLWFIWELGLGCRSRTKGRKHFLLRKGFSKSRLCSRESLFLNTN